MGWRLSFVALSVWGAFSLAAFGQDMPLSQVLLDGEAWQLVSEGHTFTEGPAADREGNVYFADVRESKILRVGADGKAELFADNTANTNGLMFGADGMLYGCRNGDRQIVAYRPDGSFRVVTEGVDSNDLVVNSAGGIYFTDPPNRQVWYVDPSGEKRVVADGFRPNGIILWPDEGTVVVTDSEQPHLWTFRVESDGGLKFGERYYGPLVVPPAPTAGGAARRPNEANARTQPAARPGSDGMTVDNDGRLYVTTRAGLQMFDPTGRLGGVIAKPQEKSLSNVVFGGPKFDTLYVTCTDKVYRRKTKVVGTPYIVKESEKKTP